MGKIIKTFEEFIEPNLEYRKGSNEYGQLIISIMEWLRLHYVDNNAIYTSVDIFLNETNIDFNFLLKFLKDRNIKKLITFNISIEGDKIYFTNLNNKSKGNYVWENAF